MSQQCGVGDFYIKNKGEITMKITLKDGSSKEYSEAKSVYEIAKDISEGLARAACAGEVAVSSAHGAVLDIGRITDKKSDQKFCQELLFPSPTDMDIRN